MRMASLASRHALTAARRSHRRRFLGVVASNNPSAPSLYNSSGGYYHNDERRHLRFQSSMHEPTLFAVSSDTSDDALLRSDVRTMGALLGSAISHHEGSDVLEKVETLRALAKTSRSGDINTSSSDSRLRPMAEYVSALTSRELTVVSRAFAHFLAVANAAESHQRCRRLKLDLEREVEFGGTANSSTNLPEGAPEPMGALHASKPDSTAGVLTRLAYGSDPVSKEAIYHSLIRQTVEIVLTAHPTQVNRRTLLEKHGRIQRVLNEADALRERKGTPYQKRQLDDALRREIASIWQTDEVSRVKPTPQSEAERGTLVLETVLWDSLPSFLRKLDAAMKHALGETYGLPLTASPFKFASWMGGDRDGNPNVTPEVTREVCLTNRIKAATLLEGDVREVVSLISGNPPRVDCKSEAMQKIRDRVGEESRAPYRSYLWPVAEKLKKTAEWAKNELEKVQRGESSGGGGDVGDVYLDKDELLQELLTVHQSLCDTGNAVVADGKLTDLIRKVSTFGLTLIPLDVRQESDRHTEALDCITKYLGLGSYSSWDETARVSWIQAQLLSKRPLIRSNIWKEEGSEGFFTPTAVDTLETFQMISEQYEESLGAYVISQCTSASDILAVLLLQLDAGVKKPLRVVPLFETLDDLNGAAGTMEQLYSIPAYVGSLEGRKQEIMVGYSDSAKDAGRLAATWAQFETQVKLSEVAKKHSVDVVYFHGKGGTVGRGGNPNTFKAILSHAPGTINGQFRVTEQGEMIMQNFGYADRAERTLDIYTAALLAEQHTKRELPNKKWIEMMNKLSDISCEAYRKIVRGDERFVPYFRAATPELELGSLNIGSRPAKRKASGGVESLRAIPWIFAWTQTRLNLPTWLGVGEALNEVLSSEDEQTLREMYNNWDSFRTTIDLVEMILSKSDSSVSSHYETMLVSDEKALELGSEIRKIHKETEQAVLNLTGHKELSEHDVLLKRLMTVRNPYVDCLNCLQAETLKRLRAAGTEAEEEILKDALLTTITGVANGMGNTG